MDPTEAAWPYLVSYYLPSTLFLLAAAMAVLDVPFFGKRVTAVAVFGVVAFAAKTVLYYDPARAVDFTLFWEAGQAARRGGNPYALGVLNPPTAIPLFALLSALPAAPSYAVFTVVNAAAAFALVFLSYRVLVVQGEGEGLAPGKLAVLAVAVALSHAAHSTLRLGQLGILVAAFVLLALYAEGRERRLAAGLLMALATVKPGTMLPFLLLWLRRRSWRTWLFLAGSVLLLSIAIPGPGKLLAWLGDDLANITGRAKGGMVNDLGGARAWSIMSLDGAFYALGITDRSAVSWLQAVSLAVLGAWIFREAVWLRRWPAGLASSVIALYSTLFLYHRTYDATVLALPLVYAAIRVGSELGRARRLFALSMFAMLGAMHVNPKVTGLVFERLQGLGVSGRLAWGLIRPYATWLVLISMASMAAGYSAARQARQAQPRLGDPDLAGPPRDC